MPNTVDIQLDTTRIVSGLNRPLYAVSPPGDQNRLFILEQVTGEVKIFDLKTQTLNPTPFLKIPPADLRADPNQEQGLLGIAFHPDYANNGKFYVSYTAPGGGASGQNKLVEYQVSGDPNVANPSSAKLILSRNQPQLNHNGGWLGFGPDGYLYWSTGDGGGSGFRPGIPSESQNSQDITNNLLGKILRLDINSDGFPTNPNRNYAIPSDNPFVGKTGDDEIWAYGLRNPWRPSFDRQTGDLYIADVGQSRWEEINIQNAGSGGGQNYGWDALEGTDAYNPGTPQPTNPIAPTYAYPHVGGGNSITGGFVYRGPVSQLNGTYFYADFMQTELWSLRYNGSNGVTDVTNRTAALTPSNGQGQITGISSFGQDAEGNLYIMDIDDGEIYRLEVNKLVTGTAGNDTLWGGPSNDTLNGLEGNDTLNGLEGNDTLDGGSGVDTMSGGTGNDLFLVDNTNDLVRESLNSGIDRVESTANYTLKVNIEELKLLNSSNLNGTGNTLGNRIEGNTGNNRLTGGSGEDQLLGEDGNDQLAGGRGNDTLTGGAGVDRYVFDMFAAFNLAVLGEDQITDFEVGTDKIVLDKSTFTLLSSAAGNGFSAATEFAVVTTDSAAATRAAKIVYNSSNGNLFYNPNQTSGGFGNGGKFAVLSSTPGLTANDFVIVN
jgi:Ca2+-binding RTX toxin-like protein